MYSIFLARLPGISTHVLCTGFGSTSQSSYRSSSTASIFISFSIHVGSSIAQEASRTLSGCTEEEAKSVLQVYYTVVLSNADGSRINRVDLIALVCPRSPP